jgi:hypothetical protein
VLRIQTIHSFRRRKVKRQWIITGALALVLLFALAVGLTLAQGPEPQEQTGISFQESGLHNQGLGIAPANPSDNEPQRETANLVSGRQPAEVESITAEPTGLFNYQGQLLHDGSPVNGTVVITFSLHSAETGGDGWWQETQTVDVENGLFNVMLGAVNPLDDSAVRFQSQTWLEVQPAGAAAPLTPRQPLGVVGYAMNLMPGATLVDENEGGPYGFTLWVHSQHHPAIYGWSESGVGVTGISSYTGTPGVYGSAYGVQGVGIYGYASSDTAQGVIGVQSGYDVSDSSAFWEPGAFFGGRNGVIGISKEDGGHGVVGWSQGAGGTGDGVYAWSVNHYGVQARTDRTDNNYGLYTPDNIYSLNYNLAGAVMHVAQNGGRQALEVGDVVIFSGMTAPLEAGGPPVVQVAKATGANSSAVAGVVYGRFSVQVATGEPEQTDGQGSGADLEVTPSGAVQPGEYLLLVVQGPAQVKASALSSAIQPGDLLSSASEIGYATKAAEVSIEGIKTAMPGTIFGKALEPLETGQKLIYVFVTLQ